MLRNDCFRGDSSCPGGASLGYLLTQLTAPNLAAIAFLGFVSYSIGSYFYLYALKVFDPVFVGNASLFAPFVTFFSAFLLIHETLQLYYIVLAGLVLLGILIQQSSKSKAYERVADCASSNVIFDITGAFVENEHPQLRSYLGDNGRALATLVKAKSYGALSKDSHGCLLFTNNNPLEGVSKGEMKFIEDIIEQARTR